MIVVIGSGIAGLSAALAATGSIGGDETNSVRSDVEVLLVTKGPWLESNTYHAQGGIAVALSQDDDPRLHAEDTLAAGAGLCDPQAVDILTAEGVMRMRELIRAGVRFDRGEDGRLLKGLEAAHCQPRVVHAGGDATGRIVEEDVAALVRADPRIHVLEYAFLEDLIVTEGCVVGVRLLLEPCAESSDGLDADSLVQDIRARARQGQRTNANDAHDADGARDAREIDLDAQAVILATGGSGQLYPYTTNPSIATGDGVSAAWRAGAEVADLEFYQFHPTALAVGAHFLISEAVRGEGARLLDEHGHRYMPEVDERAELAPRDVVARANYSVMRRQSGRPVFLDVSTLRPECSEVENTVSASTVSESTVSESVSAVSASTMPERSQISAESADSRELRREALKRFLSRRFPTIDAMTRSLGFDWSARALPVTPAAHYSMGGICTDVWGKTNLPGLFAAGECARSGVHGANRLASNSLLEGLVFGHRAGLAAQAYIAEGIPASASEMDEAARVPTQAVIELDMPISTETYTSAASETSADADMYPCPADCETTEYTDDGGNAANADGNQWSRERIQHEMWNHVGVLRDASGLSQAVAHLGAALAASEARCNAELHETLSRSAAERVHQLENRNLITLGYLSAVAALQRHESRGAHARSDFPHAAGIGVSTRYRKASSERHVSTSDSQPSPKESGMTC
ncbi:L-aspartate oxidase [Bifidobacterium crudilactis]|jgi:L-aspartate oxidase|uniref:L-aspartate oxidase n=1 Tax=Bifidobacterium crudilactis TaxID=327277 RepID=UPI002F351C01